MAADAWALVISEQALIPPLELPPPELVPPESVAAAVAGAELPAADVGDDADEDDEPAGALPVVAEWLGVHPDASAMAATAS
ncbi:MAG TPA: hypothetical protein VH478_07640, partial [Trebonia sp.]|nr:hypothetical protein [Trebonia sp.]